MGRHGLLDCPPHERIKSRHDVKDEVLVVASCISELSHLRHAWCSQSVGLGSVTS